MYVGSYLIQTPFTVAFQIPTAAFLSNDCPVSAMYFSKRRVCYLPVVEELLTVKFLRAEM